MTVEPQAINIGALYNGTTLTAKGSLPTDSEAIVRFMGTSCELHLKERGKVGGIVWMNLDSITFKGVPSVCLVSSAVDFKRLEANGGASIRTLRLSGLKGSVRIETNGGGHENAFEEFVKLKQKGRTVPGDVWKHLLWGCIRRTEKLSGRGPDSFSPESRRLYGRTRCGKKRRGRRRAEQPVTVKLVGFPALLAGLAFRHSALYGILATIIALLAGLGIGLVFQGRGGH